MRFLLLISLTLLLLPSMVWANNYTIDSTGDESDLVPGDGVCLTSMGTCTLRASIEESNADATTSNVDCNIPGAGDQTLTPLSAEPTITAAMTINCFSQSDSTAGDIWVNPVSRVTRFIISDPTNNPVITVTTNGVTIRGVKIESGGTTNSLIGVTGNNNVLSGLELHGGRGGIQVIGDNNLVGGSANGDPVIAYGFDSQPSILINGGTGNVVQRNFACTDGLGCPASCNSGIEVTSASTLVENNLLSCGGKAIRVAGGATGTMLTRNLRGVNYIGANLSCNYNDLFPAPIGQAGGDNVVNLGTGTVETGTVLCPVGCCVLSGVSGACVTVLAGFGVVFNPVEGGQCGDAVVFSGQLMSSPVCSNIGAVLVGAVGGTCAGISVERFVESKLCSDGCISVAPVKQCFKLVLPDPPNPLTATWAKELVRRLRLPSFNRGACPQ